MKKNPNKRSTPKLVDPMLSNVTKQNNSSTNDSSILIKPKLLPINPLTKQPYNSTELKNKIKTDEMTKKALAVR